MFKINKIIAILLSFIILFSLIPAVNAEEIDANIGSNVQTAGDDINTPVSLTSAITLFNVTIPTILPVDLKILRILE